MALGDDLRKAVLAVAAKDQPFTRIDVVNEAGRGKGWSDALWRQAREAAHRILQEQYNKGVIHRYGPVETPTHPGTFDYLRAKAELVYGGEPAKRPLETPNGTFPPLESKDDKIRSGRGRRTGMMRNDFEPWDQQDLKGKSNGQVESGTEDTPAKDTPKPKGPPIDEGPLLKRINELDQKNRVLEAKLREATEKRLQLQDELNDARASASATAAQNESLPLPISVSRKEMRAIARGLGLADGGDLVTLRKQVEALAAEVAELKQRPQGEEPQEAAAPTVDEKALKELIKETLAEALIS